MPSKECGVVGGGTGDSVGGGEEGFNSLWRKKENEETNKKKIN